MHVLARKYPRVMLRSMVGILACILVVAMDIAAGLFAIKAQAAQDQVKELRLLIFECKRASPKVFKLGVAAAGFLGISHILVNCIGCFALFCCSSCTKTDHHHRNSSTSKAYSSSFTRQCSLAFFLFTWVVLGIGMYVMLASIRDNNINDESNNSASCGLSHHHFLSYGAISCFVHAVSSVAFYVTATTTTTTHS